MRRSDREIKEFDGIVDVLSRCDTIRLGLNGSPFPYVVPLSFGYEAADGVITVYFHGAVAGLKHELIEADPHVCVEADICGGFARTGKSVTTCYESVIGFGKISEIDGAEAAHAMDLLLSHCGYGDFIFDSAIYKVMRVYKVVLNSVTGKRRTV